MKIVQEKRKEGREQQVKEKKWNFVDISFISRMEGGGVERLLLGLGKRDEEYNTRWRGAVTRLEPLSC